MTSKHTPEPWRLADHGEIVAGTLRVGFVQPLGKNGILGATGQANGLLMDAAPELLAALREALDAAKLAAIHEHPDTADNLPWYAAGLAAIAKAEGRS